MAQSGLHGLIGVAVARMTSKEAPEPGRSIAAKSFAYGFVTGNVLPDIDLAALAVTYLFDSKLAMRMHRTATHSLVVIGIVTLLGVLLSTTRGGKSYFKGLGAGMALHTLVDIFLWFSGVDILWPLGSFGVRSEINLWANVKLPPLWNNLLGSTDFLMMALFYGLLMKLSRRYETNVGFLRKLAAFKTFHYVSFLVYVVLSFFLARNLFDIAQYAVIVLVSLPMTWITIRGSKPTLERLGLSSAAYR